jgi:hypothetical protein
MAGLEALPSVQCVSVQGERFAVVNIEDGEALPEWRETLGDVPIAPEAYAELKAPGGDGNEPAGCEGLSSKEKRLACAKRFVLFSDLTGNFSSGFPSKRERIA